MDEKSKYFNFDEIKEKISNYHKLIEKIKIKNKDDTNDKNKTNK